MTTWQKKAGVSSAHTMQTYAGYLAESSLISLVRWYSSKPVERIRNEKLYISDMISGVFGRRFFI